MNRFAENIVFLRTGRGLKQSDMLAACGFARTTWNNYENGTSYPGFNDLVKIANYFGVSETDLIHTDLTNTHLNDFEKGGKKRQNTHLNTHPNTHLNGKNKAPELPRSTTVNEPEGEYTTAQAKDELIRTQKFTIEMLKEALAAAQARLQEAKKAKK